MANGRHSFVAFYPSDWLAGTARLPRVHRSVYFEVCCYIWDSGQPCPLADQKVMFADLKNANEIIDDLVNVGKLSRGLDGSLSNDKAMAEATKALNLWTRKSAGGKAGGKTRQSSSSPSRTLPKTVARTPSRTQTIEPEPELEYPLTPLNSADAACPSPLTGGQAADSAVSAKQVGELIATLKGKAR